MKKIDPNNFIIDKIFKRIDKKKSKKTKSSKYTDKKIESQENKKSKKTEEDQYVIEINV